MRNSDALVMDLFPSFVPEDLQHIVGKFRERGFDIYLVGGAVRNLVIAGGYHEGVTGRFDFDFATNASPDQIQSLFRGGQKSRVYTVPTGLEHGTVTVVMEKDGQASHYEITTYRVDGVYEDGRRPSAVRFTDDLRQDLSRRDFTVNALAYDITEKKIFDPFGGLRDIHHRVIRTVGEPVDRFSEDGLRPVRACRIAAQLDFKIDRKTLDAIPDTLDVVQKVSLERVHDELLKLMSAPKPSVGLEYMRETGILKIFLPEILEGYRVHQNEFHRHDVYYHNLYTCDAVPAEKPLVRLAALFHDVGKPRAKNYAMTNGNGNVFYNHEVIGERIAERALKRLKFSNADIRQVAKLVKLHMFYYTEEWSDGAVRRFLRKIDGDRAFLDDMFDLRRADRVGSGMKQGDAEILNRFRRRITGIIAEDNALRVTDLDLNGNEIMEHFGIAPSPVIGRMLEFLLEKVLDDPGLNTREKLLALGSEFLSDGGGAKNGARKPKEDISILI